MPISVHPHLDLDDLSTELTAVARAKLETALRGNVPRGALRQLQVLLGHPAWALRLAAQEHDADLVVLGGKRHTAPVRWLGGSTAHHAVRTIDVPLLVTAEPRGGLRRILVALDLSHAAQPTLAWASKLGELLDARLRLIHVVEPLPLLAEVPSQLDEQRYFAASEREFEEIVAANLGQTTVDHVVRRGQASRVISDEVAAWEADVVVVGSHGKGWVDRVIVGSTAERLLTRLPAYLLVVPVRRPDGQPAAAAHAAPSAASVPSQG